jgi:hypothetical protein
VGNTWSVPDHTPSRSTRAAEEGSCPRSDVSVDPDDAGGNTRAKISMMVPAMLSLSLLSGMVPSTDPITLPHQDQGTITARRGYDKYACLSQAGLHDPVQFYPELMTRSNGH